MATLRDAVKLTMRERIARKVLCEWLGQHNGKGLLAHWFDGASWHACCGRCGRNVMLDSQDNWFTYEGK